MPYKEFCVFFSGKLFYKSNRKLFSCVCISWYKNSRGWENSRQLCKPSTSSRVCITVSNSPNPSHVYIKLLCGQGLIMACMQSVFNKLELETCTFSSNLQWMFYFKNQCVSGSLRCSWPTYLLDHWYKRVPNRFLGFRDFPYLRLGIRDYKAKSGQDSELKVCP